MTEKPQQMLAESQRLTEEVGLLWQEGQFPLCEPLCVRAAEIVRRAVTSEDPLLAERLYNLGALYFLQRRYGEAKPLLREAIAIYEKHLPGCRRALALCQAWLGRALYEAWREDPGIDETEGCSSLRDAEACLETAMTALSHSESTDLPEYSNCLAHLGALQLYCGRAALAERYYLKALGLRETYFGPDHLQTAEMVGKLAQLATEPADREPLLRRWLAISEQHGSDDDPAMLEPLFRLAQLCAETGQGDEALRLHERLARVLLALPEVDPEHDWILEGCIQSMRLTGSKALTQQLEQRRSIEEPRLRQQRVDLRQRERMVGSDHPSLVQRLCALAEDLSFEEDHREAEELFRRAAAIVEYHWGTESPRLIKPLNGLACILRLEDRTEEARAVLERAVRLKPAEADFANACQLSLALENLAWVLLGTEDTQRGGRCFAEALSLLENSSRPNGWLIAEMRFKRSLFLAQQGDLESAEKAILDALEMAMQTSEFLPGEIADFQEQYAFLLMQMGREDEAAHQMGEAERRRASEAEAIL